MLSIKNDALAVGTVATGAAACSVLDQNKTALKRIFITPVVNGARNFKNAALNKDTYVKAKNAAGKAFKGETYKNLGSKIKAGVKSLGNRETYKNAYTAAKTKTKNAATSTWNFVVKAYKSVMKNTKAAKILKTAGIAAGIAVVALAAKAIYDRFSD